MANGYIEHGSIAAVRSWIRSVGWTGISGQLTWDAHLIARIPDEDVCLEAGKDEPRHVDLVVAKSVDQILRDLGTLCDVG